MLSSHCTCGCTCNRPAPSGQTPRQIKIDVIGAVAGQYGLTVRHMVGARGSRPIAYARHHAMAVVQDQFGIGPTQIGALFGGRDHATVWEGIRRHHARVAWGEALIAMGGGL